MTDSHLNSPSSSESAGTPSELPVTPKLVIGASGESVSGEQRGKSWRIRWTKVSETRYEAEGGRWRVEYFEGNPVLRGDGWYWDWKLHDDYYEAEGPYKTASAAKRAKRRYEIG